MKNSRVETLREVVTKLTPMLAGKGLRVTQIGTQALCECNKDGKPIRINIPFIANDADEQFCRAIQGFIDHEVSHALFTDWSAPRDATKRGEKAGPSRGLHPKEAGMRMHGCWNLIEDTFVEREMTKAFKGTGYNLDQLYQIFLHKITATAVAKTAGNVPEQFNVLLMPMIRALAGQKEFAQFMEDGDHWDQPLIAKLKELLPKKFVDNLCRLKNSRQVLAAAEELFDILYPVIPPPPPPPPCSAGEPSDATPPDDAEPSDEKSDSKTGKGENTDKPEDEDDKGSKGEKSDEKPEPKKDKEDADVGEDEPTDDEAGENSDETPPAESGEDASSDDQADEEGSPETDGDAGDDDTGDEGEDTDGDESGLDGDEADADDEGEEDGEAPAEDGAGDDGDESDADDAGDAPAADGGDDAGKAKSGGEKGEGEKSEGAVEATGEKADDAESGAAPKEAEMSPFLGLELDPTTDLADVIATVIGDEALRQTRGAHYTVLTRDWDRIEPPQEDPDRPVNPELIADLEDKTRHMIAPMQKSIERMMAARSQAIKVPGYRSGRLHGGSLHRLLVEDDRVFRRIHINRTRETAVSLVVDCSGSMGGPKIKTAMMAAFALSQTLERVGVKHEVIGFTCYKPDRAQSAIVERETLRLGKTYSRSEPLFMPIFKGWNERINPEIKKRFVMAYSGRIELSGNIDGESIRYAGHRLLKRPEPRKVMIAMSDGEPAGWTGRSIHDGSLVSDLHAAVKELKDAKVDLVGLGIQTTAVKSFYPKFSVLRDLDELPKAVMGELTRILTTA